MNLGVAHPRARALASYTILHSLGNNLLGACYMLSAPLGAPSLYQESKQAKPPVLMELWHKKMNINKGEKKSSRDGDHECGVWMVVRRGLTENYLKQGSKPCGYLGEDGPGQESSRYNGPEVRAGRAGWWSSTDTRVAGPVSARQDRWRPM